MNVIVCLLDPTSNSYNNNNNKQDRLLSRVDDHTLRVRHPRVRKALRYAVDACVDDSSIEEIDLRGELDEVFQGKDVSVCVCCEKRDDLKSRQLLTRALFHVFKRARKECEKESCVYAFNASSVAWIDRKWTNLIDERFTSVRVVFESIFFSCFQLLHHTRTHRYVHTNNS